MSRDAGFAHADVDVNLLDDPKVKRLLRLVDDEGTRARAIVVYQAVVLSSWGEGQRVAAEDAAPVWITGLEDLVALLARVGLLDADGRVVEHAFEGWFRPALERRRKRSEAGRLGGIASTSGKPKSSNGRASVEQSSSDAEPEHYSQTDSHLTRRRARAAAREVSTPKPLRELIGEFEDIVGGTT